MCEEQPNVRHLVEEIEGLVRVGRFYGLETRLFDDVYGKHSHKWFVFYHEHSMRHKYPALVHQPHVT